MNDDSVERQIEGLGNRHLLIRTAAAVLAAALGGAAYRLVVSRSDDAPTRAAAALAVSGLLFGFATSSLAANTRRVLTVVLVVVPLLVSATLFVLRTVLGWSAELPMRLAAVPLCLSLGFLAGHYVRPAHFHLKGDA